ncbi:MAG: VWA domain-containing protein [Acidobacteriota bacterium]|nr:VWA domain-containing protein [Acidobacteriota bacterium]
MRTALRVAVVCAVGFTAPSAYAREDSGELRRDLDEAAYGREVGPAQQDKNQVFRAGVEMVSLNVTVVDSQGRYVTDLEQDAFSVFEDGAKQDLSYFNRTNLPIALSLLIDSSASMEQRMEHAQEAAIGFARKIRPQDLAQVIDFDSRVEIRQTFSNKLDELERAIRNTSPGGSTALHNAVYISLKELAKIKAKNTDEVRRQAIVVLSDGEDTSSLVSFEEVLELAKRSETAIYTIGLQPRETTALRGFREAEFVLRQLAQETGGRAFFAQRVEDLKDVYGQIADELSSQYSMGYSSRNPRRDGAFRRLVVQISRPNVTARTKRGYYGPTSD